MLTARVVAIRIRRLLIDRGIAMRSPTRRGGTACSGLRIEGMIAELGLDVGSLADAGQSMRVV